MLTSKAGPIAGVIVGPTGLGAPGSSITKQGYKVKLNTTITRLQPYQCIIIVSILTTISAIIINIVFFNWLTVFLWSLCMVSNKY